MPQDEIKTRITVDADDAQRDLDKVSRKEKELAGATKEAGDQAEHASRKHGRLSGAMQSVLGSAKSMVTGFIGVGGVLAIYRLWVQDIEAANRALERNAQLTRQQAEERLDLVALAGVEDPETVAFLDRVSAFSGRKSGEIARISTVIKSRFPDKSDDELRALVAELAQTAQITSAPLLSLTEVFSTLFDETGNARVASNILQEAIKQAGEADPAKLGQSIGQFIGIGQRIGGFSAAQAAGFVAGGTGLGLPREVATTGLKNVIFAIKGKGTPEGIEIFEREKIDRDNIEVALQQIQAAFSEGRISGAELEALGGREAAPVFAALADEDKLRAFLLKVRSVTDAEFAPGRIAGEKAKAIFESSEIQSFNLLAKQQESATEGIRGKDVRAVRADAAKSILARILASKEASGEVTPAQSELMLGQFTNLIAAGLDPLEAASRIEITKTIGQRFMGTSLSGIVDVVELSDPLREALERGPNIDIESILPAGATPSAASPQTGSMSTTNVTNIGVQYNMSQDGQTVFTARTGRRDVP